MRFEAETNFGSYFRRASLDMSEVIVKLLLN